MITVPAMFELPQNEATAHAAKLAGFEHSVLLQEPVAAAVAYGFQSNAEKAYWLVYDYGGGTFDASIIAIRDGQLRVIKHAGDNYLGGADLYWKIVDELMAPLLSENFALARLRSVRQWIARCANCNLPGEFHYFSVGVKADYCTVSPRENQCANP